MNTHTTQETIMKNAKPVAPKRAVDLTHRDLSWFSERIARGQKEVFLEIVTVTPDIARRILERNPDNRNISKPLVKEIANDIRSDNWALNGETIIISKDGYLNDGQHRLMAVVEANKPIQSAMMFGVDRKSRMTVDMGKARSASTFLGMQGVANRTDVAAAARLWLMYSQGIYADGGRTHVATRQSIIRFYRQHCELIDATVSEIKHDKFLRMLGVSVSATLFIILRKTYGHEAEDFIASLTSGANLDKAAPALWARQRVMTFYGERLKPYQKLELMLRYWNAHREARPLTRHISIQGAYPELAK